MLRNNIHKGLFGCILSNKDQNNVITPQTLKIINYKTFKVVRNINLSQFDWNSRKNKYILNINKKG